MPRRETGFHTGVQGLRGLCALAMMFAHFEAIYQRSFMPPGDGLIRDIAACLGNSVLLFFIISGFVVPGSLLRHATIGRFLVDRALRIMPLFLTLHLVVFVLGPWFGYKWLASAPPSELTMLFVTNATMTAFPLGLPLLQQNSWTLSYEWGFYFVIAIGYMALMVGRPYLLAALILLSAVFCLIHPVCFYFAIGLGCVAYPPRLRLPRYAEIILLPVAILAFYYMAEDVSRWLSAPLAVIIFAATLTPGTLTHRLLSLPAMQYFGKISYSIYLVHPFVIFAINTTGLRLFPAGVPTYAAFALCSAIAVPLTILASDFTYRLLEVRLRRWITGRLVAPQPMMRAG